MWNRYIIIKKTSGLSCVRIFQSSIHHQVSTMSVVLVSNMLDVLKPLHFFLQISGLSSFSIQSDKTHGYKCRVSCYNVFVLVLSTFWQLYGIYFVTSVDNFWDIEANVDTEAHLSKVYDNFVSAVLVANCVIMTFSIWWFFIIKLKFVQILNEIDEVDDALGSLGSPVEHVQHRKFLFLILVFQNFLITLLTIMTFLSAYFANFYKANLFNSISEFIALQYLYLLIVHFNFFILSVRRRYQHINVLLKNAAKLEITDVQVYQKLASLHIKMVDITEKVSFCFGIPVS